MKKKIVVYLLTVLLALGAGFALYGCSCNNNTGETTVPKGVGEMTTSPQESGGVTFTNYLVRITNDVDWNALSKDEKQKIIDYVFKQVYKKNEENGIRYFNVNAVTEDGVSVFQLDRQQNEVIVKKDGQHDYRIPAPVNPAAK